MPLTLISGIWGMNSQVPGQGDVGAFWIIIGFMVAFAIIVTFIFRRYHFF